MRSFSVGTHRGKDYSPQDLAEIVQNFLRYSAPTAPKVYLHVPAVIGHEEDQQYLERTDIPAAGWVTDLWRDGGSLFADFDHVPEEVARLIRGKVYRLVSAEIYDEPPEGIPGAVGKMLRRVAFLGADIPQVKGLAEIPTPVPSSYSERAWAPPVAAGRGGRLAYSGRVAMAGGCWAAFSELCRPARRHAEVAKMAGRRPHPLEDTVAKAPSRAKPRAGQRVAIPREAGYGDDMGDSGRVEDYETPPGTTAVRGTRGLWTPVPDHHLTRDDGSPYRDPEDTVGDAEADDYAEEDDVGRSEHDDSLAGGAPAPDHEQMRERMLRDLEELGIDTSFADQADDRFLADVVRALDAARQSAQMAQQDAMQPSMPGEDPGMGDQGLPPEMPEVEGGMGGADPREHDRDGDGIDDDEEEHFAEGEEDYDDCDGEECDADDRRKAAGRGKSRADRDRDGRGDPLDGEDDGDPREGERGYAAPLGDGEDDEWAWEEGGDPDDGWHDSPHDDPDGYAEGDEEDEGREWRPVGGAARRDHAIDDPMRDAGTKAHYRAQEDEHGQPMLDRHGRPFAEEENAKDNTGARRDDAAARRRQQGGTRRRPAGPGGMQQPVPPGAQSPPPERPEYRRHAEDDDAPRGRRGRERWREWDYAEDQEMAEAYPEDDDADRNAGRLDEELGDAANDDDALSDKVYHDVTANRHAADRRGHSRVPGATRRRWREAAGDAEEYGEGDERYGRGEGGAGGDYFDDDEDEGEAGERRAAERTARELRREYGRKGGADRSGEGKQSLRLATGGVMKLSEVLEQVGRVAGRVAAEVAGRVVRREAGGAAQRLRKYSEQIGRAEKKRAVEATVERLSREGKLLPVEEPDVRRRLMRADCTRAVARFSENGKAVELSEFDLQLRELERRPTLFRERMSQPAAEKYSEDAEVAKVEAHYEAFSERFGAMGTPKEEMLKAFRTKRKHKPGLTAEQFLGGKM